VGALCKTAMTGEPLFLFKAAHRGTTWQFAPISKQLLINIELTTTSQSVNAHPSAARRCQDVRSERQQNTSNLGEGISTKKNKQTLMSPGYIN